MSSAPPPAPPAPTTPPKPGGPTSPRRPKSAPTTPATKPPSAVARWVDRTVKGLSAIAPIDWGKIVMKLIVSFRYAVDTFVSSLPLAPAVPTPWSYFIAAVNVVVIDVAFTLMWFIAASKAPTNAKGDPLPDPLAGMRVPAAFIAWGLFAAMLVLAGDASGGAGGHATLVARVTGGAMLAYDTYGLITKSLGGLLQRRREQRERTKRERETETVDQRRARVRQSMWKSAYALMASTLGVMMTAWYSVSRVREDILEDREVMAYHVKQAQDRRRAQEGVGGVTTKIEPAEFMIVQGAGTEWVWECRACGAKGTKPYKNEGTARNMFNQHAKLETPQHAIFKRPGD